MRRPWPVTNAPSSEYALTVDWYLTNNLYVTPGLRIFTNYGRNLNEPYGVGRFSQNDELQLKATYQF